MKTPYVCFVFIFMLALLHACQKDENNSTTLEDFCRVKPQGWDCELIQEALNPSDYPVNATPPLAIIKYSNPNTEFSRYPDIKVHPSLVLDVYPIAQKTELMAFIQSQQMYSWCIPLYFGESSDYIVLSSPCFINGGTFTQEAESSISDLYSALRGIMTLNEEIP